MQQQKNLLGNSINYAFILKVVSQFEINPSVIDICQAKLAFEILRHIPIDQREFVFKEAKNNLPQNLLAAMRRLPQKFLKFPLNEYCKMIKNIHLVEPRDVMMAHHECLVFNREIIRKYRVKKNWGWEFFRRLELTRHDVFTSSLFISECFVW